MTISARVVIGAVALVVVAGSIGYCVRIGRAASPFECPHTWDWTARDTAQGGVQTQEGRLSGPGTTQDVPDYHDCQRFIVGVDERQERYDSVFGLFASYRLERVHQLATLDSAPHLTRDSTPHLRSAPHFEVPDLTLADAVPVVQIYAGGDYNPLHLRRGVNCLYLYRADGEWNARMVSHGVVEQDCDDTTPHEGLVAGGAVAMRVIATQTDDFRHPDDYPPVARWEWDQRARIQYIGVSCGAAWCAVGPMSGFTPAPTYLDLHPSPGSLTRDERRVFGIKGWYDEQRLALPGRGVLRPGPAIARIFPHVALDGAAFATGTWTPAAHVAVTPALAHYRQRFNFEGTTVGGALNQVELCQGSRTECAIDGNVSCGVGPEFWWARVHSADGSSPPRPICVHRKAKDHPIPATTRWRWLSADESGWIRCTMGCCELIDPGG